jgi:alkylation response protein AidB-like acyl-CoA dehydrogenase
MTEDLEQYRERARAWLASVERPELSSDDYDEKFRALKQWQQTLYGGGWIGIHWPVEYGGQGLSVRHSLVFGEELARARLPAPAGAIGLEVVGPTVLHHGNDEQRRRLIPPLLSGEEMWCQGFSEPGAGSDLANVATRAERDGDELVVTGQKIWTSWATDADWCAVLARTDPDVAKHKGLSYLLVDVHSPGVTVKPIVMMTGDAEFNEIFFDEVRVPMANVLGELGDGWKLAMDTLGHERGGYAIRRRLQNQTAFLDLVTALQSSRATDSVASGVRPGSDPGLTPEDAALLVGELFVELKAFEAQTRLTGDRIVAGDVPSPLDSVDKLTLGRTEQHLYGVAAELLGGQRMVAGAEPYGLDAEEWTKGLCYARSASVYGGSAQIQRTIVAERLLGLPRTR